MVYWNERPIPYNQLKMKFFNNNNMEIYHCTFFGANSRKCMGPDKKLLRKIEIRLYDIIAYEH